jgi:acyl carrier protein
MPARTPHEDADVSARGLLVELDPSTAPILDDLGEDVSLLEAGIQSAQMIELTLLLEDRLGKALRADELDRLATLRGIDALLDESRAGSGTPPSALG